MSESVFKISKHLRMGAVRLRVKDLNRMLDFYEGFLGLEIMGSEERQIALGVGEAGVLVELVEDPDAIQRPTNAAGLYHFALLTSGREALGHALRRLIQAGYPLQGVADHYVSEAIYLADPEGNGIEVYADRPRDQWEWEGTKVRIGTIALDVDSLLAIENKTAIGDKVLGTKTRMGHMHLQVTNLEEAMRFYETALGFDPMGHYGSSAAFYSAGGYHHHIGLNTWASKGGVNAGAGMLGLVEFELVFPDDHAMDSFIESNPDLKKIGPESSESIRIVDPSANAIRIRKEKIKLHSVEVKTEVK